LVGDLFGGPNIDPHAPGVRPDTTRGASICAPIVDFARQLTK
jgi:hypothetical protein